MKYLVMCEGSNELEVVRILLANNRLIFGEDDLLGLTPYHARQIEKNAQVRTELNMYPGNDVCVIRIGDKQSDKLKIPEEYKEKIVAVNKYCTKPELEMLLIINEGLVSEFEKVKSETSPKAFAKRYICCGKKRYNNSNRYIKGIGLEYFYVVDKKVKLEGKLIKPIFTNFRTFENVMAEKEPDELDYIKTGIRKYDEAESAEIEID